MKIVAESETRQGSPNCRKLAVAVIGNGAITKTHLGYITTSPRTNLVAVADLSAASAKYAATRWGAKSWHTSHTAMLAAEKLDVVHVCTPPTTHARIVADCLHAGKHVICEKPLAPTRSELIALNEIARQRGVWLVEDQNYRWNDPILQLQEVVAQKKLGALREVEVRIALGFRQGGAFADRNLRNAAHDLPAGPIHDVLPHLVYLGLLFLPEMRHPERVSAHWSNHGGEDGLWQWDDLDATLIGVGTHLRLRFSSYTRPECFSVTLRGEEGEAVTDLFHPYLSVRGSSTAGKQLGPVVDHLKNGSALAFAGGRNLLHKLLQHTTYHGLERFLEATYAALQRGGPPPVTFGDSDDVARVIEILLDTRYQR